VKPVLKVTREFKASKESRAKLVLQVLLDRKASKVSKVSPAQPAQLEQLVRELKSWVATQLSKIYKLRTLPATQEMLI
jgi:predicted component of type VI protein secretion system